MKRKYIIGMMSLLCITGCASVPSLDYDGDELIHKCSENDLALFNDNLVVEIDDEQSFVIIDNNNKFSEYKNEKVKFNKKENLNIKTCMFVSYDDIEDNKFGTSTPLVFSGAGTDLVKVRMNGKYSYRIKNIEKYINYHGGDDFLSLAIRTNIISVYSDYIRNNYPATSMDELLSKKELNNTELNEVNKKIAEYGIEVTEVDIESASIIK